MWSPRMNETLNESVLSRKLFECKSDEQTINICDDFLAEISEIEKQKEQALYMKALHLLKVGWSSEALKVFKTLLKMDVEEWKAEYFYHIGSIHQSNEEYEQAISYFSQSLDVDPKYFKSAYQRASCYNKIGKDDLAIEDYNKAILLDSKTNQKALIETPWKAFATMHNFQRK